MRSKCGFASSMTFGRRLHHFFQLARVGNAMKRWFVRLSVLSVVLVLGLIAIAQAQRALDKPAKTALKTSQPAKAAKPIPLTTGDTELPASDPFARTPTGQA